MARRVSADGLRKIREAGAQLWLSKARDKFGDSFTYPNFSSEFETQKKPAISIVCKKHGKNFSSTPFNHLRSDFGGCADCEREHMHAYFLEREGEKFLTWFNEEKADRLEIVSEFNGMTNEIKIRCKKHNNISHIKPTDLYNSNNYGCPVCAREAVGQASQLTIEKVINDEKIELPDHVTLIDVIYDNEKNSSLVKIHCEIHGEQAVTKGYLSRSRHACPACGNENVGTAAYRLERLIQSGKQGEPTYLGVMEVEVFGIRSLKVGVTVRTLEERYMWHLKTVYFQIQMPERDAYVVENRVHRKFKGRNDLRIHKAGMRGGSRWGGDTECYFLDMKDELIDFVKSEIRQLDGVDYSEELKTFEKPDFFPVDRSREKSDANKPVKVIGIDPSTNEVTARFDSIADAQRAGYGSVRNALSGNAHNQMANGLRWFRQSDLDPNSIPPMIERPRINATRVRCLDTNQVFASVGDAEQFVRSKGRATSSSHISSVCSGRRNTAGGYRWEYADPEMAAAAKQNRAEKKGRRLTTDQFVERCRQIWGDKFSYEHTKYVDAKTMVEVTCLVHGRISVHPQTLLRKTGTGCKQCGYESMATQNSARLKGKPSGRRFQGSDKKCLKCGNVKSNDFEHFTKRKLASGGYTTGSYCRECRRKRTA